MPRPNISSLPVNHPLFNRFNDDGKSAPNAAPIDLKKQVIDYVQVQLDKKAQAKGYDSIISACTYVTSTVAKFAQEAQEFVNLRDTAWATCYQLLNDVELGIRPVPTLAEVKTLLPTALTA
jgi:hypothetical protein